MDKDLIPADIIDISAPVLKFKDKPRPETIMRLVPFTDPILRTPAPEFDFANPPTDPIKLAHKMSDNLLFHEGWGLSACQIGLPYNVFVMKSNPLLVMFNAEIIDKSLKETVMDEGCLSFPGLMAKVSRANSIRIRFCYPNGEYHTMTLSGISARVAQHETDHMNGILFTDHLTRVNLEMAIKKAKKRGFKYAIHHFGGKPAPVERKKVGPELIPVQEFSPFIFKD